ncbi:hypothetical protein Tco_1514324 [Tanacetum coccineum]
MKRASKGYSGVITPLFDTMLVQPQVPPSTLQPPITPTKEAAPMPHESPIHSVYSLGCDEGSMQQNELMDLVTTLSKRVTVLETDIQQTKKVYSSTLTKLILRVKKLEKKGRKIFEIDKDPTISLVQPEQDMEYDFDINEEENQRIARDAEITKQLQEEFDRARQEQEVVAEDDQAHDIDLSDPVMLRYHALQNRSFFIAEVRKNLCMYLKNQGGYKQSHFKGISYEDIRPIFERVWDQNNAFVPKDSEIEKEKQKLEDDAEKKEPRDSMDVVPRDDIAIDVESIATKYPIVDWKTHVLTENMMYYQIIRADGSSKN